MVDKTTGLDSEPNQGSDVASASEKTLTEDRVNEIVSKALGARLRPISDELKGFRSGFDEIKQLIGQGQKQEEPKADPKQPASDPRVAKLERDLMRVQEERAQMRAQGLRASARDALVRKGFAPDASEPLLAYLIDSKKEVKYASEDSQEIVFGDFSLDDGLEQFKSDPVAKMFLAPRGVQGSGDKNYAAPPKESKDPLTAALDRALGLK